VVTFKTAASLAPQTERKPYVAGAALAKGPRYFAGDLHVHSRESGDAIPTLDEIGTFARSRGLDFVEISDHNVNTQDDYVAASQARFPDLLFIPGIEFTTYAGHANAIGATRWVDHKIGQPGVTIGGAVEQIAAQGAIFSINHPALDIGDLCIGCAWKHTLDPAKVTGVEIETSALSGGGLLFQSKAIAFWESYLDKGFHVVGLGGGDDHRAGKETGQFQSALGSPTTLVYADELSAGAIMDAIRKGHVVVKTDGPADPMVELTSGSALPGDSLRQRSAVLTAKVTNTNVGQRTITARWVKNGVPDDPFDVTEEGQMFTRDATAPPTGEDRYRFEVLLSDNKPHLITNHIFLTLDPNGPDPAAQGSSGGGCATTSDAPGTTPWLIFLAAMAAGGILSRRRRA
jgi:MYXO-CTERM domain-containing protein